MVNFEENYHFSRFQRGYNIFQGGGSQLFPRGSNCLYPIETHITCDFPGGSGSEHDETISACVYHKCYQRRLRGASAFVQSRRVTQSFGVDEESRHLRTPTN